MQMVTIHAPSILPFTLTVSCPACKHTVMCVCSIYTLLLVLLSFLSSSSLQLWHTSSGSQSSPAQKLLGGENFPKREIAFQWKIVFQCISHIAIAMLQGAQWTCNA